MKATKKMISENPIQAAMSTAYTVEVVTDPQKAKKRLTQRRAELKKLNDLKNDLLPIETEARDNLAEQIKKISLDIDSLLTSLVPNRATMPVLDLTCLSWRDESGFPRLIVLPINQSVFSIKIDYKRHWGGARLEKGVSPKLPKEIELCYKDVLTTLDKMREKVQGIKISAKFSGTIPDNIRDLINGSQKAFDGLYIISEVKGWKVEHTKAVPVPTVKGDPLLVGWDGENFRVIAAFDVTTVEKVALERSRGNKSS